MFRTARVTLADDRFGETITDIFRVLVTQQQDSEVRAAVHAAGFRDFRILLWGWTD